MSGPPMPQAAELRAAAERLSNEPQAKAAIEAAIWVTASPHEWVWHHEQQVAMARYVVEAAKVVSAVLAETDATPQWQPIETAPRDGTLVLLHGKCVYQSHRKGPFIASWSGDWPGDDKRYWRCLTPGLISEIAPTHWMPLPEPPALGIPIGGVE